MENEIKEILDNINNKWEDYKEKTKQLKYVQDIVSGNDFKQLLNYITNLQDRIKELEAINEEHRKINGELREKNERLKVNCNIGNENLTFYRNSYKDYKTRNKKAIELIYKAMKKRDITGNGTLNLNELLEILQGGDNNE